MSRTADAWSCSASTRPVRPPSQHVLRSGSPGRHLTMESDIAFRYYDRHSLGTRGRAVPGWGPKHGKLHENSWIIAGDESSSPHDPWTLDGRLRPPLGHTEGCGSRDPLELLESAHPASPGRGACGRAVD